jgi:hypothetical protein
LRQFFGWHWKSQFYWLKTTFINSLQCEERGS